MTQFAGKVALVTGASRGLGAALVERLLARDVRKVYAGVRDPHAHPGFGDRRATLLRLDVSVPAEILTASCGADDVQILVNNAGINKFGSIVTAPFEAIEAEMAVNYFGAIRAVRALAPIIETNGGGAVINVISICAFAGMPGLAGYSASKAALFSATQSMRPELEASGIEVYGAFPGPIDTDMNAGRNVPSMPSADEVAEEILDGVARGDRDIFPDPIGRDVGESWASDPKALEARFSSRK